MIIIKQQRPGVSYTGKISAHTKSELFLESSTNNQRPVLHRLAGLVSWSTCLKNHVQPAIWFRTQQSGWFAHALRHIRLFSKTKLQNQVVINFLFTCTSSICAPHLCQRVAVTTNSSTCLTKLQLFHRHHSSSSSINFESGKGGCYIVACSSVV